MGVAGFFHTPMVEKYCFLDKMPVFFNVFLSFKIPIQDLVSKCIAISLVSSVLSFSFQDFKMDAILKLKKKDKHEQSILIYTRYTYERKHKCERINKKQYITNYFFLRADVDHFSNAFVIESTFLPHQCDKITSLDQFEKTP